jgi:hypothetical protein
LGVCEQDTSLWLEPDSLKNELRRQGVKVDDGKTLNLTFPNGAHVSLTKEPYSYFNGVTERETFTRAGVIQFTHLYAALLGQPGLLRLEGWSNPTLYIGQVELQIGTEKRPVWGSDFYPNVLMGFFFSKDLYASAIPKGMTYILDVGDVYGSVLATEIELTQPGVYGVITLLPRDIPRPYWMDTPEPSDILVTSEVFEVQTAGSFTVSLPEDVQFVTSFGKDRDENVAVLVRLSGQGITAGYDIVSPEKITLEPSS